MGTRWRACFFATPGARPARSVLDFSLCFQLSCLFFVFVFVFVLFLLLFIFFPLLLFFFLFSISLSVACLSASSLFLRGTQKWHLARFIAHQKLYSSLSFFSSKPIKYRNCRENVRDFRSCLMIDLGRETDGNNEICLGVHFALCTMSLEG